MTRRSKYEWPPTDGLIALCRKYGLTEASRRLGVSRTTLRDHFDAEGITREDTAKEQESFSDDVLREIAELVR